ncbi:MAG: hypothetical protein R3D26_18650 [Cyanobacteriota/Melainabacteria group bacterium]
MNQLRPLFVESGYTNAVEFLVNSVEEVVGRAERVLTGQGNKHQVAADQQYRLRRRRLSRYRV